MAINGGEKKIYIICDIFFPKRGGGLVATNGLLIIWQIKVLGSWERVKRSSMAMLEMFHEKYEPQIDDICELRLFTLHFLIIFSPVIFYKIFFFSMC